MFNEDNRSKFRSPTWKYRIRTVTKNKNGTTAYALNIPAIVKERFGETLFSMYIMEDKIIFASGCDFRRMSNEKKDTESDR